MQSFRLAFSPILPRPAFRMAPGATVAQVLRLVLAQGGRQIGLGLTALSLPARRAARIDPDQGPPPQVRPAFPSRTAT